MQFLNPKNPETVPGSAANLESSRSVGSSSFGALSPPREAIQQPENDVHKTDPQRIAEDVQRLENEICYTVRSGIEGHSGVGDAIPSFVSEPTNFESSENSGNSSSGGESRPEAIERLENQAGDTVRSGIERHSVVGHATPSVVSEPPIRIYAVQMGTPEYYELKKQDCEEGDLGCRVCFRWMQLNNWVSHIRGKHHVKRWGKLMNERGEPQEPIVFRIVCIG